MTNMLKNVIIVDGSGWIPFWGDIVIEDGKIAIRRLVTHRTQGQNWIVEEGLKPGEKVVIEGLQRIRPGVPVQIVPTIAEQEQAKAAKASKQ